MAKAMSTSSFDSGDRLWFRIGGTSFLVGMVLLMVVQFLHPGKSDPSNSPLAFAEYAADRPWVLTHLLQLTGTMLLMVPALLAVYVSLAGQSSAVRNLARLAFGVSLVGFAVYAVDMGIDGIALKRAVDAWAGATAGEQQVWFAVAQGIRWVENGVLGVAGMLQGLSILLAALAMTPGALYARWIGWVGTLGGLGFFVGAIILMLFGFMAASMISLVGFLAIFVWSAAVAVRLLRI